MTRRIPNECPTRPANARAYPDDNYETLDLDIQVVTPMFGGGAEAGVPDPVTLIRPSSIRGHLRFWWRATRGAECSSIEELKRREVEIFGDTVHPSPVVVEVQITSTGITKPCASLPPGKSFPKFADDHPSYALFPFQGNAREGIPICSGTVDVRFSLRVRCPKPLISDVTASLWAWINFGGLGSRTRRGCGALYCRELSPNCEPSSDAIRNWFHQSFVTYGLAHAPVPQSWPLLGLQIEIKPMSNKPMKVWNELIGLFRTFRQGTGVGRNGGSERPGRSHWPEPETVRRATGKRLAKHQRQVEIPNNVYPRAEFGLPIIFHFKDAGDPPPTQLVPDLPDGRSTRMASPLILKPLAFGQETAIPVILQLVTRGIASVVLEQIKPLRQIETKPVRAAVSMDYLHSPVGRSQKSNTIRSTNGSALEAFRNFAKENGFHAIGPEVQP